MIPLTTRPVTTPAPAAIVIRGVLVLDDELVIVRPDGTTLTVLAGGHPRPGCSHATARARACLSPRNGEG